MCRHRSCFLASFPFFCIYFFKGIFEVFYGYRKITDTGYFPAACCSRGGCRNRYFKHRGTGSDPGGGDNGQCRTDGDAGTGGSAGGIQFKSRRNAALLGVQFPHHGSGLWAAYDLRCGNPRKSAGFAGYPVETNHRPGIIWQCRDPGSHALWRLSAKNRRGGDQTSLAERRDRPKPRGDPGIYRGARRCPDRQHCGRLLCALPRLYQKCGFQRNLCHLAEGRHPCQCAGDHVVYLKPCIHGMVPQ